MGCKLSGDKKIWLTFLLIFILGIILLYSIAIQNIILIIISDSFFFAFIGAIIVHYEKIKRRWSNE